MILIGILLLVFGQLTIAQTIGGPGFAVPYDLPSLALQ
jgi:hypothetical protein